MVASDKLVESRGHDRRQAIGSGRLAGDVDMRDEIELVGRRGCLVVVVEEEVGCCRWSSQGVSCRAVWNAKRVDCCKRMLESDFGRAIVFLKDPFKHHEEWRRDTPSGLHGAI